MGQGFNKPCVPCDVAWHITGENHFLFVCVRCPRIQLCYLSNKLEGTFTSSTCLGTGTKAGCVKCKGQDSLFLLQAQRCNICPAPGPLHFSETGDI